MKKLIVAILAVLALVGVMAPKAALAAGNAWSENVCNSGLDEQQKEAAGCNTTQSVSNVGVNIINVVTGIVAVVAVIVIGIAGQRFASANGDPSKVATAKQMVLWAVIGLIVSGLAFAIVSFVSGVVDNHANTGEASGGTSESTSESSASN